MLTLFTTPKPFVGHIGQIQRNAIRSWTLLAPECEVILFGDEPGAAATAAEFGIRHVPQLRRNQFGTPLLDDLFAQAKQLASHDVLAYVNADIILMKDFLEAVRQVAGCRKRFFMVGQRRNIDVNEPLSFDPNWEQRLRKLALRKGDFYTGIDYFVFPRNLWEKIPPFAIGRVYWDNWLLYAARLRKAAVIDVTPVVLAIHQNHMYKPGVMNGPEPAVNQALLEAAVNLFTTWEATHVLTRQGLKVRCRSCYPACVCNFDEV
jgi:hypothetical protein